MDEGLKKSLLQIAGTIRILSMDAVQKANSGHPGLPLGCAELGAYLYGCVLQHNPKNTRWLNRDRFILSAGHGSMWLYSCLHLSGFNLSLDEIKNFRQLHSKTPGHPEYHETEGVEATTGPLGQGVGNAVGQALGLKLLGAKFNTPNHQVFDAKVFCLAGDGCMMEGISNEAASLAGHLRLDNLVLFYDYNNITLDGHRSESCSEDVHVRFKAYDWDVIEVDGYDLEEMERIVNGLRQKQERPTLVIVHTIIGRGSPHKAGSHKAHGSPLGPDEVTATKQALGLSLEPFYIAPEVKEFFAQKLKQGEALEQKWNQMLSEWKNDNKELAQEFDQMNGNHLPADLEKRLWDITIKTPIGGRSASNEVINTLADMLPQLYGGSADLSGSDMTMIKKFPLVAPHVFNGRNIKYGVREFAMAAMAAGLWQTQMIVPFIGTFLTFSDYMRNAIRLACLSKNQVIYHFTHDSIFLGEDGPTHQPVEHYAALRALPNLQFIRPADSNEVKMAWIAALKYEGPTAFSLSRQNLPELQGTKVPYDQGMGRGGYVVFDTQGKLDYTLFSTGSEVNLAIEVAKKMQGEGKKVRVVSMPCWSLFDRQPKEYRNSLIGKESGRKVAIEAGVALGWHRYIGCDGIAVTVDRFGASAPAEMLAIEFQLTPELVLKRIYEG